MSTHAKYSPSKLPFLALCPGWQSDPTPGPQAIRGTAIHGWLAKAVSEPDPVARQALLRTVPADLAEPVSAGLMLWSDLRTRFPDHDWHAEFPSDTGIPDVFGTADLVGISDWSPVAVVCDWKTGRGERDDAGQSLQCAAYALGVLRRWPHVQEVVIVLGELEQEPTESTWTAAQLDQASARITSVAMYADFATVQDYRPSPKACQYCARREGCPALVRDVTRTAEIVANNGPHTIAELTPVEVGNALRQFRPAAKLVADFIDTLEKRAKDMIAAGTPVPGWSTKETNGARAWTAPDDVVLSTLAPVHPQGAEAFRGLVSPAEAERILTAAIGCAKITKRDAQDLIKGICLPAKRVSLVEAT
jgi:RecB family exonuclease